METALGYKNLVGEKNQYYSDRFLKKRREIQDCEDFQPCRKFIAEELAVHLIIDIKTVKAAELEIKLGFKQVDPLMSTQESIGLRLKKTFLSEKIIEDFSTLILIKKILVLTIGLVKYINFVMSLKREI